MWTLIIIIVVVVVVDDDTHYWVYLSSNNLFQVYYKVRQVLLQSATAFFITKCDKCYYKVRQVLQSVTILLQRATGIAKCDDFYKVRQYMVIDSFPFFWFENGIIISQKQNSVKNCWEKQQKLANFMKKGTLKTN